MVNKANTSVVHLCRIQCTECLCRIMQLCVDPCTQLVHVDHSTQLHRKDSDTKSKIAVTFLNENLFSQYCTGTNLLLQHAGATAGNPVLMCTRQNVTHHVESCMFCNMCIAVRHYCQLRYKSAGRRATTCAQQNVHNYTRTTKCTHHVESCTCISVDPTRVLLCIITARSGKNQSYTSVRANSTTVGTQVAPVPCIFCAAEKTHHTFMLLHFSQFHSLVLNNGGS